MNQTNKNMKQIVAAVQRTNRAGETTGASAATERRKAAATDDFSARAPGSDRRGLVSAQSSLHGRHHAPVKRLEPP